MDFANWIATRSAGLKKYARRRASKDDAEDLAQEVLLRSLRTTRRPLPQGAWPYWVYGVARLVWLEWKRATERRNQREVALDPETIDPSDYLGHSNEPRPAEFGLDSLRKIVGQLPLNWRDAFVLRDLEQCSYEEVGRRLDCPASTAADWASKARAEIARCLRWGTIVGAVLDHERKGIQNAQVTVRAYHHHLTKQTRTTKGGLFTMVLLPPDTYVLAVHVAGQNRCRMQVEVPPGSTTLEINVEMKDVRTE